MNKEQLHNLVEKEEPNICQIVAYKDDVEVYSDTWNGYQETDTCHVMSVTKSVVSLLIGIAIDQGLIAGVEQPVLDFFPEYRVKDTSKWHRPLFHKEGTFTKANGNASKQQDIVSQIKIKHLLTMTAPYHYVREPWAKVCTSDDWTIAALDLLGGKNGITGKFRYSTLGIHILCGILSKVSHMTTVEYANQYLFEPLGITAHENYLAKTAKEHREFTVSKLPKGQVWFCDPQGVGTAGYGLCLAAKDMAKIGLLYLHKGEYKGKRIVSESWICESTKPYIQCNQSFGFMSYGYLWWIVDQEKGIYSAIGDGGNVIYVNPEKNCVITVAATYKPRVYDRVDFIQKYIETAAFFTSKK